MGALVSDVTERRAAAAALHEREALFHTIVETIPQMVWVGGVDGRNEYNNRRLVEYSGLTQDELRGDGWTRTVHPEDMPSAVAAWERAHKGGEPFSILERVRRHDGEYRWFVAAGAPLRGADGRIFRWIGTWTDVHDWMLAQEALRNADRRKDEFLGVLSHELRNPLAPIRNAIEILERAEPAGEHARWARQVLARQVGQMTRLIDDLLDSTRIARGKIELRRMPLDLAKVVRRAVEDHRPLLEERGIELATALPSAPMWTEADEARLAQVVGNLLQNAAKFTPAAGRVLIALGWEGETAVLHVSDTGVGIDPTLLSHVFEPFTQGEQDGARVRGGLGLGLALVKGIVELHHGSVEARSGGPGQGADFLVRVPLLSTHPAATPPVTPARALRRLHVLVVDDNEDAAHSLARLVELFGHSSDVAPDGPSALAKARNRVPDALLCDLGLPGMSGYEVAVAFRSDPVLRRTRLIAVSGYARPEDRRRTEEAGFAAHVAKPPNAATLEALLAS